MTSIMLNGEPALDPVVVCRNFDSLFSNPGSQFIDVANRSKLAHLCNRFAKTTGPNPSYGYFAMARHSLPEISNTDIKLVIQTESTSNEQEGLVMVDSTSLGPITYAATGGKGDVFVVEVADKRYFGSHPWMRLDTPGQKMFNVVSPLYGQDQYYTDTLDDSLGAGLEIPWDWQSMLDEVWPAWLGESPTLPHSYASGPVGFDFRGFTNYQAVVIILTALNKQLALDADGSFYLVDSGSSDSARTRNNKLRSIYKSALDEAIEWSSPVLTHYPKGVTVHFQKTATNSGSENVFTKETGQWYTDMEHTISVDATSAEVGDNNVSKLLAGSYQQIWDDLPAWVDPYTGVIANLSALTARASEKCSEFYENLVKADYRMHEVYSQFIDFEICGTLQAVSWTQSLRRGGAWLTEIFCHPRKQMMINGGELVPAYIQPSSPWQWRSAPIYPPETMLWRNDGFLSSGSASGTADDEYNGHEIRYDPATKTYVTGIYVKGAGPPS